MNISVLGCGRWGSFHAWYANSIGHKVTLWGRTGSTNLNRLVQTGRNDYLTLLRVEATTSGLTEIESIPLLIKNSVKSGYTLGACPQIDTVLPSL